MIKAGSPEAGEAYAAQALALVDKAITQYPQDLSDVSKAGGGLTIATVNDLQLENAKIAASELFNLARITVSEAFEGAATGDFSDLSEALNLGEAIPFIGAAISLIAGVVNFVESAWAEREAEINAECAGYYVGIEGTGPEIMPCDIMIRVPKGFDVSNISFSNRTAAGVAFTNLETIDKLSAKLTLGMVKAGLLPDSSESGGGKIPTGDPSKWGISDSRRARLAELRKAIQLSAWTKDGGRMLMPLYLDIILACYADGSLNRQVWMGAWVQNSHKVLYDNMEKLGLGIDQNSTSHGYLCGFREKRGFDQARKIVNSWDLTRNPYYDEDKDAIHGFITKAHGLLESKLGKKINLSGLSKANLSRLNYGNSRPVPSAAPVAALGIGAVLLIAMKMKGMF